jgi:hypothetical protein
MQKLIYDHFYGSQAHVREAKSGNLKTRRFRTRSTCAPSRPLPERCREVPGLIERYKALGLAGKMR